MQLEKGESEYENAENFSDMIYFLTKKNSNSTIHSIRYKAIIIDSPRWNNNSFVRFCLFVVFVNLPIPHKICLDKYREQPVVFLLWPQTQSF